MMALMDTPAEITGPINVGNPGEFTIRELAEMTIELTNSPSKLIFEPLPQDDPKRRKPDITKAREILKWEPVTPLREGLAHTIAYFQDMIAKGLIEN
jgi:UDP-glucuronate decarboxylase